jgi:IS30 family transposase
MAAQLTLLERERIAQFLCQGLSKAEIGRRLGRHRSTIGRELARNGEDTNYWASTAQEKSNSRRRARCGKLDDKDVNKYVRAGLARCWLPEQIAGRSRLSFRQQPQRWLSHSTIYRWIASDPDREH